MKEELFKGLTEEQVAKAKACETSDELLALAKTEGIELSEEQLAAVTGGGCGSWIAPTLKCSKCGCKDLKVVHITRQDYGDKNQYICKKCGHSWSITLN